MMGVTKIPVLTEDGLSLDWEEARYETEISVTVGRARVDHCLEGADQLRELIATGCAEWATEVRCPNTLFSQTQRSPLDRQEVYWDARDVGGMVYVIPGLVAVKRCTLTDTGLSELWRGEQITVPVGSWLIRGRESKVDTLVGSLLRMREDDTLTDGRMRVVPDRVRGRLRFIVEVASDIYATAERDLSLQIAALVSACSQLPEHLREGDPQDETLMDELRERFEAEETLSMWDDEDGQYEPALAATVLAPFSPLGKSGTEDDHDGCIQLPPHDPHGPEAG